MSQILHLVPLPVEVADLLWLVLWQGRCSRQRHCSSSRGLSNTLTHDMALSVSAVKGYSSALNSVLALKGRDLASSREIMMLLRSFSRSVDPVELRPPAWEVALVLQSLTGAPYEPLRTCDERFLCQKTLFLLALASVKRIGELHALSYRVSHSRAGLRFPFLSSRASWQRLRIPFPLLLGLRALLYRPYQTREIIAMGDC